MGWRLKLRGEQPKHCNSNNSNLSFSLAGWVLDSAPSSCERIITLNEI